MAAGDEVRAEQGTYAIAPGDAGGWGIGVSVIRGPLDRLDKAFQARDAPGTRALRAWGGGSPSGRLMFMRAWSSRRAMGVTTFGSKACLRSGQV